MSSQALLLLLVLAVGTIHIASGSHFRGGLLSWKTAGFDGSSYKVDFTFRLAFRRSFSNSYYCNQNTVNSNGIIGQGDYWRARCVQSYCGIFNVGSVGYHCTEYSTSEDWSQGENNFTVNFPNAGPWLIGYTSCCWISLAHGGSNWYLSSTVNLTRRSDTGSINSSPVSASSPIVRLQQGCKKVIKIPTEDPDGDKVRCRWSTASYECGGACKSFKYGKLDEGACTITFDGNGQFGWYAVALMLEDYPQSTVDFSAASPFSSVGLQFLVNIASNGGSCNRKPYFTGSTPAIGSCLEIRVGSTYHATIEVKHVDSGRRVQEINLVAPTGVLRSNILSVQDRFGEIVYQKNVSWTPSFSQTGQHIVCFTALDNSGIQSDRRCLTILVGLDRYAPMAVLGSRYPYYSVSYSGYGQYNTWSIRFDRPIKKPQKSSFIRFLVDGHVIFKLDTCVSKEVTVTGSNNTLLSFRTPSVVLSMRGTYSIVLDAGSIVGRGCSSDGPPTPGVTSPTQWTVYSYGSCSHGYYRGMPYSCLDVNECMNPAGRYRRSPQAAAEESGSGSGRQKRWVTYAPNTTIPPTPFMMSRSSVAATPAECSSYTTLSADRSTRTFGSSSWHWNCDYWLNFGWYRFTSNAGARMPEYCVPTGRCGTDRPGWLNGTHPTSQEGVVTRKACFHESGNCCRWTETIWVRNCSGFYVYKLGPTHYSCMRYCYQPQDGNTECSSYKTLSSADRSVSYPLRTWNCDYNLNVGWYRFTGDAGTQMPEYCVPTRRCGSDNPGWLNGTHPTLQEGAVTREVCFHYSGNCCRYNITVWVRNCGGFYVYRLEPPRWYCVRYCGYGNVSSSVQVRPSPTAQASSAATQVWPSVVGPTQSGSNPCGDILRVDNKRMDQRTGFRLPCGWLLCFIDQRDTSFHHTQCRDLILNVQSYTNANSILQAGGNYGCWHGTTGVYEGAAYASNHVIRHACIDGIQHSTYLVQGWNSGTTTLGVCIRFPSGVYTPNCSSIQPTPSTTVQAWSSSIALSSACYQHYTRSWGYISSPNYPGVYNNNHDCIWNITLPYGYVRLQFIAFFLESCPYDYLNVTDGPTVDGQRLGQFCGRNLPPIMYSTGRHLVLHFHSDGSVRHTGFRIYYSTVYSVPSSAVYINPTATQPYITPTPVQSVAPSTSAVHDSFVLYLPANCQHDCVNTRGSYYCRCYEGYKLNSDRKTCSDINECNTNNGGCSHQCRNIPGSYYCACLQGQTISSDNKTCIEPGVEVTCNENYMQVDLDRAHFKSFDPSFLHLWYQGCGATTNSTHISLRTPLNGCGTKYNETHDKLTFYNEVNVKKTIIKGLVTRSFEVHIPFYCEYSKSSIVHVSFKPFGIIKGYEGGFGNFTFRMDLFKTSAYTHQYGADDYPISVQLNEPLYIQYSVESLQRSLVVFADTCRATPSRDPYSRPQYVFLMNGCPEDTTLAFNYNQNPVQRFTIRAFKFLADYPVVYLHCRVMACHKNTVGSRCSRGCQRSIRKKRDLTKWETEKPQPKETQTYDVPSGPIVVRKDKTKETGGFDRAQATLVGSVSGIGGVFLIIAIILAVIVVKKGYIKKFKRRNKVDNIYGREQGTRTNTYVKEDDFAADEEDFTARADELTTKDEGFVVREDVFVNGEDKFTESGC